MNNSDRFNNREVSLDALRGIAALFVLISHTTIAGLYKVEPMWSILKWTPLKLIWSGHQAVILFFVLSGFALVRLWQSIDPGRLDAYLLSRVIRLFPPYIVSILLALVTYHYAGLLIEWNKGWMNVPKPEFTLRSLLDHILMIGKFNTSEINPPIWSIVHEMRISILFPFIYLLVSRLGASAVCGSCMLSIWIAWALLGNVPFDDMQVNILTTLHYSTFFVAGAYIALHHHRVVSRFENLAGKKRMVLWVVAVMIYAYPFDNPWNLGQRAFGDLVTGLGSILIIGLALTEKSAWLGRLGRHLGKISYSLYLNHMLVLNLSLLFFYKVGGALCVWIVTIIGAVLLATIMNQLVELPSIAAARYVRSKLQGFKLVSKFNNVRG